MLRYILLYMREIHIHNILSNGLYTLVWFFSAAVACFCHPVPSMIHSLYFSALISVCQGWPLEQHCSDPLAIWLPVGFSHWRATTGARRMGKDEDWVFITLSPNPSFLPALAPVWQQPWSAVTLDPIRPRFLHNPSFHDASGTPFLLPLPQTSGWRAPPLLLDLSGFLNLHHYCNQFLQAPLSS